MAFKKRTAVSKKSGYRYKERSAEAVKKRADQTGGRFDSFLKSGIDIYKTRDGENNVRILPPSWDEADHYGYEVWVHSFINDQGSYLCLAKMKGKPCAICDAAKETRDGGDAEEAKKLDARKVILCWVVDREERTPSPEVWQMSWTMDKDIALLSRNRKTGKTLFIDHPDSGYDVSFNKHGSGMRTKYSGIAVDREPSPIADKDAAQEEILAFIMSEPIPGLLIFKGNDYLTKVVEGSVEAPDEDEEDEKPRRGKKPASRRERLKDDDDEGEEEEDEEDEKPRKSKAKSKSRRDDDEEEDEEDDEESDEDDDREDDDARSKSKRRSSRDDDEEEDEDDDEEEEKPARKSKSKSSRRSRDDDDEDEDEEEESGDEDEEEEDERPARRSTKKTTSRRR